MTDEPTSLEEALNNQNRVTLLRALRAELIRKLALSGPRDIASISRELREIEGELSRFDNVTQEETPLDEFTKRLNEKRGTGT
ncbi:hypothetical protein HOT82_gp036 [Gordonia phage Ronaldo]|uniref:Uncharacterized protein n=4 Tax=Ronaldovirus TaxID=2733205 RepID=A0A6B9LEE9_9CAUD|nr:hypothetical protein HOT81_gp033 [Gordonia phage Fryberger]YP_009807732.1 hypothetical protein HOT82_gp036 [Gordonia phage Ronaldo]QDH48375.1 hypothetical protein SEA_ZIKO_36 [Gordonia phage Ziko]QHB38151.1 hypothetical protein SEA_VOLT_35 [Gordonia phage Volt]QTF81823.1 hypothetical protein SEA_GUEY18_38 [Gordonia phage Guey18]AXN53451.1 hypothetical protein SEA_FRYBERGER_33 [Gordonia phage Fryberger]AXN53598.1 hypothetical protein SEA_RONALDO_36 [Gordonia phage Ronaldo]